MKLKLKKVTIRKTKKGGIKLFFIKYLFYILIIIFGIGLIKSIFEFAKNIIVDRNINFDKNVDNFKKIGEYLKKSKSIFLHAIYNVIITFISFLKGKELKITAHGYDESIYLSKVQLFETLITIFIYGDIFLFGMNKINMIFNMFRKRGGTIPSENIEKDNEIFGNTIDKKNLSALKLPKEFENVSIEPIKTEFINELKNNDPETFKELQNTNIKTENDLPNFYELDEAKNKLEELVKKTDDIAIKILTSNEENQKNILSEFTNYSKEIINEQKEKINDLVKSQKQNIYEKTLSILSNLFILPTFENLQKIYNNPSKHNILKVLMTTTSLLLVGIVMIKLTIAIYNWMFNSKKKEKNKDSDNDSQKLRVSDNDIEKIQKTQDNLLKKFINLFSPMMTKFDNKSKKNKIQK